jgi:hypothetical protein
MGNSTSAYTADKLEDLLSNHVTNLHSVGYNDVIGLSEVVTQLTHTQFYQIKSTSLIVAQKVFLKRDDNQKMDLVLENLRYLNKTIPLSTHPYFLLSISLMQTEKVKNGEALNALSRQHLYSTLDERLSGGIPLEYQQKMNLALQILICGAVLHDLK